MSASQRKPDSPRIEQIPVAAVETACQDEQTRRVRDHSPPYSPFLARAEFRRPEVVPSSGEPEPRPTSSFRLRHFPQLRIACECDKRTAGAAQISRTPRA